MTTWESGSLGRRPFHGEFGRPGGDFKRVPEMRSRETTGGDGSDQLN